MTATVKAPLKLRTPSRQRILEAAVTAFESVGYQNATIDDIAESAGVARRTIYHHFKTKSDILEAAFIEQAHLFLQQVKANVPLSDDFPSLYIDCLCYVIEHTAQSKFFMLQTSARLAIDSTLVYFTDPELTGEWLSFFSEPFARAQSLRQINANLELQSLLNWFGRIAISYLQFRRPQESMAAVRQQLDTLVKPAFRVSSDS